MCVSLHARMDLCLPATMALYFHNNLVVWIGKQAGLNENSVLYIHMKWNWFIVDKNVVINIYNFFCTNRRHC